MDMVRRSQAPAAGKPNTSYQTGHARSIRPLPRRKRQEFSVESATRTGTRGDQTVRKSIRGIERNLSDMSLGAASQRNVSCQGRSFT